MPPFSVIKCLLFSDNPRCHSSLGNKLLPAAYRRALPEAPEFLSARNIPARINRLISPYRTRHHFRILPVKALYLFLYGTVFGIGFSQLDMTELRYSSKILLCASTKVSNLKLSSTAFTSDLILLVPIILPQKSLQIYKQHYLSRFAHFLFGLFLALSGSVSITERSFSSVSSSILRAFSRSASPQLIFKSKRLFNLCFCSLSCSDGFRPFSSLRHPILQGFSQVHFQSGSDCRVHRYLTPPCALLFRKGLGSNGC